MYQFCCFLINNNEIYSISFIFWSDVYDKWEVIHIKLFSFAHYNTLYVKYEHFQVYNFLSNYVFFRTARMRKCVSCEIDSFKWWFHKKNLTTKINRKCVRHKQISFKRLTFVVLLYNRLTIPIQIKVIT